MICLNFVPVLLCCCFHCTFSRRIPIERREACRCKHAVPTSLGAEGYHTHVSYISLPHCQAQRFFFCRCCFKAFWAFIWSRAGLRRAHRGHERLAGRLMIMQNTDLTKANSLCLQITSPFQRIDRLFSGGLCFRPEFATGHQKWQKIDTRTSKLTADLLTSRHRILARVKFFWKQWREGGGWERERAQQNNPLNLFSYLATVVSPSRQFSIQAIDFYHLF